MKRNNRSGFSAIEIILVLFVLFVVVGVGYRYYESTKTKSIEPGNKVTKITSRDVIYFEEDGSLYSVNVKSKAISKISSVDGDHSGALGVGNGTALNSSDFSKVAFENDGYINVFDGSKSIKINQPNTDGKENSILLNSWSADSNYLLYSLLTRNPVDDPTPPVMIDDDTAGMYVYSFKDERSTKLPIVTAQGWIGDSTKIAYLAEVDNKSNMLNLRSYDIITGSDNLLSKDVLNNIDTVNISFDGSKILYQTSKYDSSLGKSTVEIVVANIDNTNKQTILNGNWADFQNSFFEKNSNSSFVVNKQNTENCTDRTVDSIDGSCYVNYVMRSGSDKRIIEIEQLVGNYDENTIIAIDHKTPESNYKPTLVLVNLKSGEITNLYTGAEPASVDLNVSGN